MPAPEVTLLATPATVETLLAIPATVPTFEAMPATVVTFALIPATVLILADCADTVVIEPIDGPASAAPVVALNANTLPFLAALFGNDISLASSDSAIVNEREFLFSISCIIA